MRTTQVYGYWGSSLDQQSDYQLLESVLNLSYHLTAVQELSKLLPIIVDEILPIVNADRGHLILLKPNGSLDFRINRLRSGKSIKNPEDQISHSIVQETIRNGKIIIIQNALTDPQFYKAESVRKLRIRSAICAPLITPNNTIGAIYIESRSDSSQFQEENGTTIELFAQHAAVAIENAQLNEELIQMTRKLYAIDELKTKIAMLISHELRTPVSGLSIYLDLFKRRPEIKYQKRIQQLVGRIISLVDEFILAFDIISGTLSLKKEPLRLQDVIQQKVKELADVCSRRNLLMKVEKEENIPILFFDKKLISTVFSQLLSNAIKYTPDGGKITIKSKYHKSGKKVVISIIDTGIGIPLKDQENVFSLFYTQGLDSPEYHSTSKFDFKGGGLGLGLFISRGIIQAHQGTIIFDNRHEYLDDTVCIITLPLIIS
ncbi:MAG: GAF domain-containing protein [Chloroflexi bacterium]|nr:GAF domain-containing protein [Chloroflexota bacterium]